MPLATPITSGGLASGIDTESLVQKLLAVQSTGLQRLQTQKAKAQALQSAYTTLGTKISALKANASALASSSTYDTKSATPSNTDILSSTALNSTAAGTYNITVVRRSTASRLSGNAPISTGTLNLATSINSSGLSTAVTGDSDPNIGSFTVNGVSISYDLSADTLNSVISKINNSTAGVNALYDKFADRMVLTNKSSGSGAVTVTDNGTSNLATGMGMTAASGATTALGQTAQVTIDGLNNGNPISSNDDVFADTETGITGLSFTLKADTGSSQITVANDSSGIRSKVDAFVSSYNAVVDYIAQQSAVTGTDTNKTPGLFTGDQSVQFFQNSLREMLGSQVSGLPNGYNYLGGLGVGTTGQSPDISVFDADKLTNAFINDPISSKALLSDSSNGIMSKLTSYLQTQYTGASGLIQTKASSANDQIARLNTSIDRETINLQAYEARTRESFAAMERAISSFGGNGISAMLSSLSTSA